MQSLKKQKAGLYPLQVWLVYIFLVIVWGASYFFIKRGLVVFNPAQIAMIRIGVASAGLLPVAIFYLNKQIKLPLLPLFLAGIFGNLIPAFLFSIAQQFIQSSTAGILNSLTPVFTLLFGAWLFSTEITWRKVAGICLGLIGAISLVLLKPGGGIESNVKYGALIILATGFYGININILKKHFHDVPAAAVSAICLLMIGPICWAGLFFSDVFYKLSTVQGAWESFMYLVILGFLNTAIALVLFNWLIKQTSALFASTGTFLTPIISILLGALDHEAITGMHLAGMCVILTGVWLTTRS